MSNQINFLAVFNKIFKTVKQNKKKFNMLAKNMWYMYAAILSAAEYRKQNPVKINYAWLAKKFRMDGDKIKYYISCLEIIKLIKRNIGKGRYGKNQVQSIFISNYYPNK